MTGRSAGKYFLCLDDEVNVPGGFEYVDIRELRRRLGKNHSEADDADAANMIEPAMPSGALSVSQTPKAAHASEENPDDRLRFAAECFNAYDEVYAAFTAFHLDHWYRTSRFCGRCGKRMIYGKKERMMECPACGNQVYPRINPAVIVGVISPDHKKLLVTQYARSRGVKVCALVAGFTEIGETFEDTVRREVMEEVGLRVKNIRYYKSQPWGIADDILAGFYCEAEEGQEIRLDTDELRSAVWQTPEEITGQPDNLSLTNEMMIYFKEFGGNEEPSE
ncbi:MAG: NAD(+) diphosphatase, partial [Blautia sp.]|nr:NAD(+) diphosphatase [Blautia sp.]